MVVILIIFLSGRRGAGKSEAIKAFVYFAKILVMHSAGNDVMKVTSLDGATVYEIPDGRTLHSQAYLSSDRIGKSKKKSWISRKMLIIDEVSFFDEDNLKILISTQGNLKTKVSCMLVFNYVI